MLHLDLVRISRSNYPDPHACVVAHHNHTSKSKYDMDQFVKLLASLFYIKILVLFTIMFIQYSNKTLQSLSQFWYCTKGIKIERSRFARPTSR